MPAKFVAPSNQSGSGLEGARPRPRGAIVGAARTDTTDLNETASKARQGGMSLLDFYRNRSERVLSARERRELETAKASLRGVITEPRR